MAKQPKIFPNDFLRFVRDTAISSGSVYREHHNTPPELEKAILALNSFIVRPAVLVDAEENEQLVKLVSYLVWSIKHMGGDFAGAVAGAGEGARAVWGSDPVGERVLDMLGVT